MLASFLLSMLSLLEPIFLVEIRTREETAGSVYEALSVHRGQIVEECKDSASFSLIKTYVPVLASLGLTERLRAVSAGRATNQSVFDHWDVLAGDPLTLGPFSNKTLLSI